MESIISVSVLVFRDESIMFLKKLYPDAKYRLVLPGGILKDGEDIEECGKREVMEAAGIRILLDRNLGGVITRRGSRGGHITTFILLGEALDRKTPAGTEYIPYKDVQYYYGVSDFSRLILKKLNDSPQPGMKRDEFTDADGKKYLAYF